MSQAACLLALITIPIDRTCPDRIASLNPDLSAEAMVQSSSHPETISFRLIEESQGRTLEYDPAAPPIGANSPYIGTYDCRTCVGVYFPIKPASGSTKHRCFIAHINAWIEATKVDDASNCTAMESCHCLGDEGGHLEEAVVTRLVEESEAQGWGAADVDREKAVLVAPKFLRDESSDDEYAQGSAVADERKTNAHHVVQAIRKFLQEHDQVVECDTDAQGFIVDLSRQSELVCKVHVDLCSQDRSEGWLEKVDDGTRGKRERRFVAHSLGGGRSQGGPWYLIISPDPVIRPKFDKRVG